MKMISYWKDENGESPRPFYDEDGELFLIYGYYDHKNRRGCKSNQDRCIGVYWNDNYPTARARLAPCVIPQKTAESLLKGIMFDLITTGNREKLEKVAAAMNFLKGRCK